MDRRQTLTDEQLVTFWVAQAWIKDNILKAPYLPDIKIHFLSTDFPGLCFASTRCATVEPGNSWDLAPFCGRSTCAISEDEPPRLLELVEDCGPLPLANPKCKLDTGKFILIQNNITFHPHQIYKNFKIKFHNSWESNG